MAITRTLLPRSGKYSSAGRDFPKTKQLGKTADFKQQFPDFHLMDKVDLEEESDARPPILFTYNRRNKKKAEANEEGTRGSGEDSKEVGDQPGGVHS